MDMTVLAPLIVAPLAGAMAKLAEKAPAIPYQGASKLGIVAALTAAAFVCRVALAWATDTLATVDWQAEVRVVVEAVLIAAGGYALTNNSKPTLPG